MFCVLPDAFSQQVIATIAVGHRPTYLAADPKTNRIYVSNQSDNTVSVIDGATNQVLATVTGQSGRFHIGWFDVIAIDANGRRTGKLQSLSFSIAVYRHCRNVHLQ